MGVLTREMLEFGLMDTNNLVKTIVSVAPFPFPGLPELRDKYLYNITPWTHSVQSVARRGLRGLFYSDDEDESAEEDEDRIAVATAYGLSAVFRSPRRRESAARPSVGPPATAPLAALGPTAAAAAAAASALAPDRERLALDISALKQQYARLRERQRQAHIILSAACARQPLGPSVPAPAAMNHLLLGKSALLPSRSRRVGPPPGAVPPPAQRRASAAAATSVAKGRGSARAIAAATATGAASGGETLHWKDAKKRRRSLDISRSAGAATTTAADVAPAAASDLARRASEAASLSPASPASVEEDEDSSSAVSGGGGDSASRGAGRGGRSSRGSSVCSSSSSSTELCDEPDRMSDFDSEEPTSLSEAASSPVAASPVRSPLAPVAGIEEPPSGAPVRASAIPRTVSSFNVLESIAELENSIARCAEEPSAAAAQARTSPSAPEQGLLRSQSLGSASSPTAAPLVVNPISPPRGTTLAAHSFPSPALAAIPSFPPASASVPASVPSTVPLSPLPAAPAPSSLDDRDFEVFAQQRLAKSPSVELGPHAASQDKQTPTQESSQQEPTVVPAPEAASEPFSFLSSALAQEFNREEPEAIEMSAPTGEPQQKDFIAAEGAQPASAEPTATEIMDNNEGGDLAEAVLAGRRNSARALRIIQENTEILQRIIQAQQQRRSSVGTDQDRPGGTRGESPEPSPAPTPIAFSVERRPSGPHRTPSPAVSPARSPPASPPPSPASPGAAAATAERGRRLLDDISALCHPTSPENPAPAPVSAATPLSRTPPPAKEHVKKPQDVTAPPARRPFSPKTASFLKSFDELLKPPSPPPTPNGTSPSTFAPRPVTRESEASVSVDKGPLNHLDDVVRGVSPEPPLARRYTTHFIDALFEPPRTPSPLPMSASATYLSDVAAGRRTATSPLATLEHSSETSRDGSDRGSPRKTSARDEERRKTTSYLSERREIEGLESTTRERVTFGAELSTSPSRSSVLRSKTPEQQTEDFLLRHLEEKDDTRRRLPCADHPSAEFRRHLRSPSPSSRKIAEVQRRSRSPSRSSDELGDFRQSSYLQSTKMHVGRSSSRSSDDTSDFRLRSHSPTTNTQIERSPSHTSDEHSEFRCQSYSPTAKTRAETHSDTLELARDHASTRRTSPSLVTKTTSDTRERPNEVRDEIGSFRQRSCSPAARRSAAETTEVVSNSSDFERDVMRKRSYSPARKEATDKLETSKEEVTGDTFDDRRNYSPGRTLLSVSETSMESTGSDVGEFRRHSYSPHRKTTEGDTSRESYGDIKRQSYRSVSIDSEIKTRETSDRLDEKVKQTFSPSRRPLSESTEMKTSDSLDLGDLQKHRYSPSRRLPSDEPRKETSSEPVREFRRYHSYSPSRRAHPDTSDVKTESFSDIYVDSREFPPSRKISSEKNDEKTSDANVIDSKKRHYSTLERVPEPKRVGFDMAHGDYQRQQYSPPRRAPTDLSAGDYTESLEEYHSYPYSSSKSVETESRDYSYEEYKNQQYSPSEILELERKARLSIDTSDEYRPFSLTKASPVDMKSLEDVEAIAYGEIYRRPSPSGNGSSEIKTGEDKLLRDYHRRTSPSSTQMKSRGSMEFLDDYSRRSYSPSKKPDDLKADVEPFGDGKLRSYSPSQRSLSECKMSESIGIVDDYKHHAYSPSKRKQTEMKSGGSLDLLDDYQRPSYSPSRRSASEIRSDDSLDFLDEYQRRSSPSRKTTPEHRRETLDIYEDYKSSSYSTPKKTTSESRSGDVLDLLDDYSHQSHSISKRASSEMKSTESFELLDSRRSYSPSSRVTPQSKSDDHSNRFEYQRRSRSPSRISPTDKVQKDEIERGFGDYQRPTRVTKTVDTVHGDSGAFGDFDRGMGSPSRRIDDWKDDRGSTTDTTSRNKMTSETRGRTSAEAERPAQGQIAETAEADVGGIRRRLQESPIPSQLPAHSSQSAPESATTSASASADTVAGNAEQAARPQPPSPEAAWRPSLREALACSAASGVAPASGTVAQRRRAVGDSEGAAPPPPPSSSRSGGGGGGPRASSASPRRRRRPSDADLLTGCRGGTDLPPYAACCPPFVVSPLSEAPLLARGADATGSLPPHGRPASPIISASLEERAPPPPPLGRRASASGVAPLAGAAGSPPPSPHYHAAFHTKPCGAKSFASSATSAFSRYPHRGRERPTSLMLDGGSAAAVAAAAFDAAPLYKSLSMLSLGDSETQELSTKRHQKGSRGKMSPQRRSASSDLSTDCSSAGTSRGSPPYSPARAPKDLCANLPPLRPAGTSPMPFGSPVKSPSAFSPFPTRSSARQHKELGVRLGLYAKDGEKNS